MISVPKPIPENTYPIAGFVAQQPQRTEGDAGDADRREGLKNALQSRQALDLGWGSSHGRWDVGDPRAIVVLWPI